MTIDEKRLSSLIEESEDLQSDALHLAKASIPELTEIGHDRAGSTPDPSTILRFNDNRRSLLQQLGLGAGGLATKGLVGGGLAAALFGILARPASAQEAIDVQVLQTASSLEILAVATYEAALGLDFIKNGNKIVKAFAETTMKQHNEHKQAFQAQTKALGGKEQTAANPKYAPVVEQSKPKLKGPGDVVMLAATLEEVATDTYLANLSLLEDTKSKEIMASVMGVESQHLATLRAVGALLAAGKPELIAIPVPADKLPAAAGSVAFPEALQAADKASPPEEGAIK